MRQFLVLVGAFLVILVAVWAWSWASRTPVRDVSPLAPSTPRQSEAPTELEQAPSALAPEVTRDVVIAATAAESAATAANKSGSAEWAVLALLVRSQEAGEPLQGVRMLLWPVPDEPGFSIRGGQTSSERFGASPLSDEHGRAFIEVPAGRTFRLTTASELAASATLEIGAFSVGERREVELRLATGLDLRFVARVVDDESGEPLTEAHARLGTIGEIGKSSDASDGDAKDGRKRLQADGEGYIEVVVGSWQGLIARVDAPGYAWVPVVPSEGHATRDLAHEVRLRRAGSVEAHVVALGALALEGIRVELSGDYHRLVELQSSTQFVFSRDPARWSALTDAQGRCRIDGLPPGVPLDLSARPQGEKVVRIPGQISLAAGETRVVEIELGGGATLTGWLKDVDGAAVGRAEVWLMARSKVSGMCMLSHEEASARTTRTDADGRFRYEQVPDGEWLVGCSPDGPFAPHSTVVVVADGRAGREAGLIADGSLFLRGRVLDPEGRPVEAHVFAGGSESGCFASDDAGADGSFAIGPLVRGSYMVSAMASDPRASLTGSEPLTVDAGTSDLILTLQRGGVISGRVVDPITGLGVQADVVAAVNGVSGEGGFWMLTSSEDGTFRIDGLAVGTYSLAASTNGIQFAQRHGVQLAAGQVVTGQVLSLEPGARLRVRYDGSSQYGHVRISRDGIPVAFEGIEPGGEATLVVPAGTLEVLWSEYAGTNRTSRTQSVDVAVGDLVTVEFERAD
jgi:hypothetical protein